MGVAVGLLIGAALAGGLSYFYFATSNAQANQCVLTPNDRFQVDFAPFVNESVGPSGIRIFQTTLQPQQFLPSLDLNDSAGEVLVVAANFSSASTVNSGYIRIDYCHSGTWFVGDEDFGHNSTFTYFVPPSTQLSFAIDDLGTQGHQNSTLGISIRSLP
jgi:hypothetical protein